MVGVDHSMFALLALEKDRSSLLSLQSNNHQLDARDKLIGTYIYVKMANLSEGSDATPRVSTLYLDIAKRVGLPAREIAVHLCKKIPIS